MLGRLILPVTLIVCVSCAPAEENIEITSEPSTSEENIEINLEPPTPEEIEKENRDAAENLARLDNQEDYQPYLEQLNSLGKRCYELDPKGYRYPELMPSNMAGGVRMAWRQVNESGGNITTLQTIALFEESLAIEAYRQYAPSCFNAVSMLIRDRYEN